MFPFSSLHYSSFAFGLNNITRNDATPISDVESESKSANGDLCLYFEGLFKKQDQEESTRSSEWSIIEKKIAFASKVDDCYQNQDEIKQSKTFSKQKNFVDLNSINKSSQKNQENSLESQAFKEKNQEQINLSEINDIKKKLLQKRNKLTKYRQKFLPLPCYIKLPQELLKMIQIAQKIDCYLVDKKLAKYTDNVFNIFKTLFYDQQISDIWSTIKKLMFITNEHYIIRIDPLKNLCISFSSKKNRKPQVRKQKLRKLLGQYYFNNRKTYIDHGIPEAYIEPVKTFRFYPKNLNLCPEIYNKKADKKYVSKLQEKARNKQAKFQQIQEKCQSVAPASPQFDGHQIYPLTYELEQFCQSICKIYAQKKVSHMYKSTLIENLRKNTSFSLEKIFYLIKYITKQEIFLQVMIKSGCKIFSLIEKEKQTLIDMLKAKRGQ